MDKYNNKINLWVLTATVQLTHWLEYGTIYTKDSRHAANFVKHILSAAYPVTS